MFNIWFVKSNINGLMCIPITLVAIIIISYSTLYHVIYPVYKFSTAGIAMYSVMVFLDIMVIWSWIKSMFTEPGRVMNAKTLSDDERAFALAECSYEYCEMCNKRKPFRAHHCSKCQVCVLKMDHHCQWINNCVGARNQKHFILFLLYIFLGAGFAFVTGLHYLWATRSLFTVYIRVVTHKMNFDKLYFRHIHYINSILPNWMLDHLFLYEFSPNGLWYLFLAIEVFLSLFIEVFVLIMLWDQVNAIRFNMTYVEYLKQYRPSLYQNSFYDSLVSTMGEPFCWKWFFPVEGKYMNANIHKLSMEFLRPDDTFSSDEDEEPIESKKNK